MYSYIAKYAENIPLSIENNLQMQCARQLWRDNLGYQIRRFGRYCFI